jgi:hypothetical protein
LNGTSTALQITMLKDALSATDLVVGLKPRLHSKLLMLSVQNHHVLGPVLLTWQKKIILN